MPGEADSLTLTLGYFASATVCPIASASLPSSAMAMFTPMWSMINVSCGCCSAILPNTAMRPRETHHGKSGFFDRRPEPVGGAVREPRNRARVVEDHAHAQHPLLRLPFRQQIGRLGILQRDAAHDAEALGITLDRLEPVVVAVTGPGRRHDHRAIDASFLHHRHQPLDRERLRQLRLEAGDPWPVRRLRLPQMDLRIDDQAPGALPARLARTLRRQHRAGAEAA